MTLNSTSRLAIAELVIYATLIPIVVYILVRHGRHGFLGWFFLTAFCILRMVADGLEISDRIKQSKGESFSIVGPIINSVGVSPLLLALAGVLFEAGNYTINNTPRVIKYIFHFHIHMGVVAGIALAAMGSAKLASPETSTNKYSTDNGLLKAGYLILLAVLVILVLYAFFIRLQLNRRSGSDTEQQRVTEKLASIRPGPLVSGALIGMVFTAARVIYGVVYAFSNNKAALSPVTGGFAIKFLLVFGVQLVTAVCLIVGGLNSLEKLL